MVQKKLPLINSAHGSETRNIINELIKLFNGMGYTYNEAIKKAHDVLDEAQKKSNNILTEAERVNAMNESVQNQINTLIAESGTSDAEVLQARIDSEGNEYDVLKTRLDEKEQNFSAQLAQTAKDAYVYAPSPTAYWVAPEQPAARVDIPGHFTDGFAYTADQYINDLFEPLRNDHPEYINRTNLGKDESGTYDIWRYDFTPENYEKTIIVIGGLHGGEVMGTLPFYRFMKEVSDNWKESGQLAHIRHKVRIVSIPILNPWGVSQMPRTRQNSNGVDINRNFDINWNSSGSTTPGNHAYKGTAPFSEKESQYVRDLIVNTPDATALLDLHALGAGNTSKGVIYVPRGGSVANEKEWKNFLEWFVPKGDSYAFNYSISGTCSNYASIVHGLYASTPEWPSVAWGGQALNGIEITKATEYFGNIIIMHTVPQDRADVVASTEPVTHYANYSGANEIIVSGNSYQTIDEFTMEIDLPSSGIILMQGEVTAVASNPETINYFLPSLGQSGGLFNPGQNQGIYYEKYYNGVERTVVPLIGAYPVKFNAEDSSASAGKFRFELKIKVTPGEGTLEIRRYHMALTFIPSSRADSVKFYQAQVGGTMELVFNGFK